MRRRVLAVALFAAVLHMLPYWYAASQVADGWEFVGNMTISDDYSQYRLWERQVLEEGPIVSNRWTSEPNKPHLFVAPFWVVGKLSQATGVRPETMYHYLGMPLAFLLVLLVFWAVRRFIPDDERSWPVFLVALFGGGLGAHLKILSGISFLQGSYAFQRLVAEPLEMRATLEDYRGNYLVSVLLDTHYLIVWAAAIVAVILAYDAIKQGGWRRVLVAAIATAVTTVLHVYEGITIAAIVTGMVVTCWPLIPRERAAAVLGAIFGTVGVCYVVLGGMAAGSGLPIPGWRAPNVMFLTFLIGYPITWFLMVWRGRGIMSSRAFPERALMGWILGCAVVTLSGPFYPYPDRGTMTLQVSATIMAGILFFGWRKRLVGWPLFVALAVYGGTPLWLAASRLRYLGFRDDAPFMFVNAGHRAITGHLEREGRTTDVLFSEVEDARWLAPTYRGRHWAGHFFLTVDYERKRADLIRFLERPVAADTALWQVPGARWLYINAARHPDRFVGLPGLTPVVRTAEGWLYEVSSPSAAR